MNVVLRLHHQDQKEIIRMDNPCTICGELRQKVWVAWKKHEKSKQQIGDDDCFSEAIKVRNRHERICNVGRQYRWLMN